ncbi:unnamed protein product [Medioppia subpectinata]|uniref:Solute carrier organic anion transporter family member n=1 Tax=Medioppia subpectinata TaxID=1979941 RepID=A0A7R9PVY6_9ACAR|nr:unnamed protein product [Medioppia subpectinata]CAG2102310.1 unnamed protein product [Medioppia subpectinata]
MCGLGSWQPKWLQIFASTKVFMVILGGLAIAQSAAFSYIIASVTTLEKRYAFGSAISGYIILTNNFTEFSLNPVIGYLADRVHRPRLIAICNLIVAFSCYLAAAPYFIYGPGVHLLSLSGRESGVAGNQHAVNTSALFCDANRSGDKDYCDNSNDVNTNTVVSDQTFRLSRALGQTTRDGIVDKEDKSFAIGLMICFTCVVAMIPYPIIYGSVVDGSCLIWESRCGQRGNCWVYDTNKLQRIVQNMSATYLIAVLTSLEKRFAFDSKISGIILIADNVMEMILSPIVGYLGNRFSRPRMIALSELVLILSCVVNASPYFFYGPGTHLLYENSMTSKMFTNTTRYEVCAESRDSVDCSATGGHSTVWLAVFILILGSALRGIGYSAFWCFGVPFIDDSVSKENSPIYMSFLVILRMFGPAGGFLLGSFCLKYYENPFFDPCVTRTDPRFIGAWWIGFLAIGFILFFINMPMFLFPAQLKGTTLKEITSQDKSGRGIWVCAKRLATNPLFMFNMIGNGLRYSGFAGYGITKPKYMESQYRVSGSKATLLTGVAGMVPDAIGILVGGIVIKYFKPKPLTLIIYMFAIEWVGNGGMLASMYLGCPPLQLGPIQEVATTKYNF